MTQTEPAADDAVRLVEAGDAAVLVEFSNRLDPMINERAIRLAQAIREADLPGVRDVLSTYRSVAIHFDPLRTNCDAIVECVQGEAAKAKPVDTTALKTIRVPVCYGGEFGPDLGTVAAFAGIGKTETVERHTSRTYRVFMLGFSPGFAYMGTVDERIAAPRLPVPRVHVPAGSVGIAGLQTGIYPSSTPGGWQIVGRTPVKIFDLGRPQPFMLNPGTAVEFYAIEPGEYGRFEQAD